MGVMNNYQEALDILVNAKFCRNAEHEKQLNEVIETLQELVDKATPNNIEEKEYVYDDYEYVYTRGFCPNCKKMVGTAEYDYDYCQYCGQKLDWSEDEIS